MLHAHMIRDANVVGALCSALAEAIEDSIVEQVGLAPPLAAALVTIQTRPGITVDALSRILGLSHSGAVRVVDHLEKDGLVARERRGREVALRVTRAGLRVSREVLTIRSRTVEVLLGDLPARTRSQLVGAASALLAALTTGRDSARRVCRLCDQDGCTSSGHPCPVDAAAAALGE
jgi:MarR family transcriptional repressor of emrRAB